MQEQQHGPYQQPPIEQQERYQQARAQHQAQEQARRAEQQPPKHMPTTQSEQQAKERFFSPEQENQFRSRWNEIQIEFVSDPWKSAEDANKLISDMVQTLEKQLSDRRTNLEQGWQQGKPSTEDLRVAIGHYRSFFDRLLAI